MTPDLRIAYLHGFLGDPSVWRGIGGEAFALPGHGGGPVRATWDDNLAAVAAAIGPREVVVGYSLGARVAAGLVATGRVAHAVLISVNPGIDAGERAARRASDAAWAALLRARGLEPFLDAWEAQPLFASQRDARPDLRAARRAHRLALDPEQLARSLEVMGLAEMPDYRPEIDATRFTLIAGAEDPKYLAIARALPAPVEVIAGAGHDPTLEQPYALAGAIELALARFAPRT